MTLAKLVCNGSVMKTTRLEYEDGDCSESADDLREFFTPEERRTIDVSDYISSMTKRGDWRDPSEIRMGA